MPLKPEAVEILRKVQKTITEEPRRFDMGIWQQFISQHAMQYNPQAPPCGTVGCIAGWICMIHDRKENIEQLDIQGRANDILSLPEYDEEIANYNISDKLFFVSSWVNKSYRQRFNLAETQQEKVAVASEYIDYFIEHFDEIKEETEDEADEERY